MGWKPAVIGVSGSVIHGRFGGYQFNPLIWNREDLRQARVLPTQAAFRVIHAANIHNGLTMLIIQQRIPSS